MNNQQIAGEKRSNAQTETSSIAAAAHTFHTTMEESSNDVVAKVNDNPRSTVVVPVERVAPPTSESCSSVLEEYLTMIRY